MPDDLTIAPESPAAADGAGLIRSSYRELAPLYGAPLDGAFPPLVMAPGRSAFLVARIGAEAIGCGAVVPLAGDAGEIKRVYVRPAWRGRRVAARLLAELERLAAGMGYRRLRLETGDLQPAAIRLYQRAGYQRIPCWEGDPDDLCYEKEL